MFYKGKCFTSSDLRSFYLKEQLGIDYTPKVLENTTVQELSDCRGVKERITDEIVYITSVSSDRLIMEPDYILPSPIKRIVLYGRITRRFSVGSIPSIYSVKGEVENRLVSTILKQYRFAFVDYDLSCINNRYSAPVKIYEYIDCCCTVVFGRMSPSFGRLINGYPALFCMFENIEEYIFRPDEYNEQRKDSLKERTVLTYYFTRRFAHEYVQPKKGRHLDSTCSGTFSA